MSDDFIACSECNSTDFELIVMVEQTYLLPGPITLKQYSDNENGGGLEMTCADDQDTYLRCLGCGNHEEPS